MLFSRRPRSAPGFTLIELLVVITIIALLIGILLPSLGTARLSARKTACAANAKSIALAALAYGADHQTRCPPDRRTTKTSDPMTSYRGGGVADLAPTDEEAFKKSWLGVMQAGEYINSDPAGYDCPVIDDHRKLPEDITLLPAGQQRIWYTDYVMALYAINQSPETAADPLRAPLITEPNMPRGAVSYFETTIAQKSWFGSSGKGRDDLEQKLAGSLSFAFADGHVGRVPVPREDPYPPGRTARDVYPDLFIPAIWSRTAGGSITTVKLLWLNVTPASARDRSVMLYVTQGPQTQ